MDGLATELPRAGSGITGAVWTPERKKYTRSVSWPDVVKDD